MHRYAGIIVSFLDELEEKGAVYTVGGGRRNLIELFSHRGINCVRLRIWIDPVEGLSLLFIKHARKPHAFKHGDEWHQLEGLFCRPERKMYNPPIWV